MNTISFPNSSTIKRTSNLDEIYKLGMFRYFNTYITIIRNLNYDDFSFSGNTDITRDELLLLYEIFDESKNKGRLTEEDIEVYFAGALVLYMVIKNYRRFSDLYV